MTNYTNSKTNLIFILLLSGWIFLLLYPLFDFIPASPSNPSHPWRVESISSIILFAVLFWLTRNKFDLEFQSKKFIPFLLFILWSGFSAFWAKSYISVAHHTFVWIGFLFFFCIFFFLLGKPEIRSNLISAVGISVSIIAFLCILESFGSNLEETLGTFRIRYAKYAEMMLTISPIFFAYALQSKNRRTVFLTFGAGMILWFGAVSSLSKGALLSGIIAFAIFFGGTLFLTNKIKDKRKVAVLLTVWLVATLSSQISILPNSKITTTDFITGVKDKEYSTTHFRLFTWKISGQMIADNVFIGVGADNFGLLFNDSRKNYAAKNPSDTHLSEAEHYFVQRSHNEFLQIFAELGIVGFLLFILIFLSFAVIIFRAFVANGYNLSPILWGCLAGMSGFLASSAVSSFSFRVMQNGIVFFFVAALATVEAQKILRRKNFRNESQIIPVTKLHLAFASAVTVVFCAVSLIANLSNYLVALGETEKESGYAESYFEKAVALNPENSTAYFSKGLRLYLDKQPEKAAPLFKKAIETGFDVGQAYFYLASSQAAVGNSQAAQKTLAEAISVYPKSIFLRVRYAILLTKNGQQDSSDEQLRIARQIDEKQAIGWFEFMSNGVRTAALKSEAGKNFPQPVDLLPEINVSVVLDEQISQNLFPEQFARNK